MMTRKNGGRLAIKTLWIGLISFKLSDDKYLPTPPHGIAIEVVLMEEICTWTKLLQR